jgi:uncharacterized protein (DUF885 family)
MARSSVSPAFEQGKNAVRRLAAALGFVLVGPALLTAQHGGDDAARAVTALADEVVAGMKQNWPEIGTFLGLPDADHGAIQDNSLAAREKRRAQEDGWHARLGTVDAKQLVGRPEWIIHGFLTEALNTSFASRVCEVELWSVDQMGGWQTLYGSVAQMQPVDTPEAQQRALARFQALGRFVDREIANLRAGLRRGYSAPKVNVEKAIAQLDGFSAEGSPYYSPAERTDVPRFATAWHDMVRADVVPAFRRYQHFLRSEYLPRARATVGVSELPDGDRCYRARLREMTSLELTAEEVHETGLAELKRIQAEQRALATKLFNDPDLDKAFTRLDAQRWKDRDEVIGHARKVVDRAVVAMPRWFGRTPTTKVIVSPTPRAEEATAADRYQIGTIDGTRPGEYQINLSRWVGQRTGDLESIVFHETIPGHHLQLSLSLERPSAHLITKFVATSAFSEGWGLYAERLADQMGLYSSDAARLGMWRSRAYRAARLVVDTGLHAFKWPRQRAIDFMKSLRLASDAEMTGEVDRYIIWPGQATAYMVGALEIERLRAEAERRLGSRFDIKRFHDTVLEDGSVPLPLLRVKLEMLQ